MEMPGSWLGLARPGSRECPKPIPGMSGQRLDQGSGASSWPRRDDRARPVKERLIGHGAVLMEDAQRPIHPLFHDDMRSAHPALNLVELATVGHGPISPEHSARLHREHGPHIRLRRQRPMQIGGVRRGHREPSVVPRQPGRQDEIRRRPSPWQMSQR